MAVKKKSVKKTGRFGLFRKVLWITLIGGILSVGVLFFMIYKGVFGDLPTFDAIENPESSIPT